MVIQLIQFFWIMLIVIFSFTKIGIGVALYLVYLLLVPYMQIRIGVNFSYNLINALLLAGFFWNFRSNLRGIKYRPFYPFVFYFFAMLMLMPFQRSVPFSVMMDFWFRTAFNCLVFPLILWNIMLKYPNTIKLFSTILTSCIVIASLYGLIVIYNKGVNPYLILMAKVNGIPLNIYYLQGGRLFGRVSSVFGHPMTYGVFLGFSLTYILSTITKCNRRLYLFIVILLVANVALCGVRSVIGGSLVAVVFYLLRTRKISKFLYLFLFLSISMPLLNLIPGLNEYAGSIFDFDATSKDVGGSSYEMRFEQLRGALYEIQNCQFWGKGYAWNFYYQRLHGDHPVLLAFESLIFMVLCNSGFCGIVIWGIFVFLLFRTAVRCCGREFMWIETLTVFYITYSCITGEYEYMKLFAIFYTIMLANSRRKNENGILA